MTSLLENVIGLDFTIRGTGDRWKNTEEHSSLVLDVENQVWFWNSRGLHGTPLDYLVNVKGLSPSKARSLIMELEGISLRDLSFPEKGAIVVPNEKLVDVFWKNGTVDRDYWYRRCLNDATIDMFRLGKYDGFWTIPIFVDGRFRNFQFRTDIPEKRIRPWYRGVGPLLYNSSILKFVDRVFITEGPVDAILLNQFGFPAVSHTGGSNGWDVSWFPRFSGQSVIYYVADNDESGYYAATQVAKSLGENRVKLIHFYDHQYKCDAVDFFRNGGTKDQFIELVNNAGHSTMAKELHDKIKARERAKI